MKPVIHISKLCKKKKKIGRAVCTILLKLWILQRGKKHSWIRIWNSNDETSSQSKMLASVDTNLMYKWWFIFIFMS